MFPLCLSRPTTKRISSAIRCATTIALTMAASLAMACQRSPANTIPPPSSAAASLPGDTLMIDIADDAEVRVKVAGGNAEWQEGHWVTTSAGCKGVLLADALLVRLAALAAVDLRIAAADGNEWQPVPLTRIRDGEGCADPAGS